MGRAIVRLAPDEYVEWSTVVDAPVTFVQTRAEMLAAGEDPDRLDRADRQGHSYVDMGYESAEELVSCNRAGPKESSLTIDAIRRRFANPQAYELFVLEPEDIKPFTCDDGGVVYWIPWPPGQAPTVITDDTDLHAQVLLIDRIGIFCFPAVGRRGSPPSSRRRSRLTPGSRCD